MKVNSSFLTAKYCMLCFEPLENDNAGVCASCGQKTTAINVGNRLKLDGTVDKRYRNAPQKAAAIFGASALIQLIYSIFALFIIVGLMSSPFKSSTDTVDSINLVQPDENDPWEDLPNYIDKAKKYDTYEDFLESCMPLAHEIRFYDYAWSVSAELRRPAYEKPKDPVPEKKTENSIGATVFGIGGAVGIILFAIASVISLRMLWCCSKVLLDRDNSLIQFLNMFDDIEKAYIGTLNFISFGMYIWGLVYIGEINVRLGGSKVQSSRNQRIYKAKHPLGDTDEWCCKYCGYINEKRDSECKSCGKYR